ncbi:hypothetical protein G20c_23 [Thermus phage G20c]|nr:hypothetical protein G20c_23 [Thermus phage G20c]
MPHFAEHYLLTISCPNCGAPMRIKYAKDEPLYVCEAESCNTALWWDSPLVIKLAGLERGSSNDQRNKRAR